MESSAALELAAAKAEAQTFYLSAESFFKKNEFERAKDAIAKAIELYPANPNYQALRERILTVLGKRSAEITTNLAKYHQHY